MNQLYGGVYIPNLANNGDKYGIGQYRFAHNYELLGRQLTVIADGKEYAFSFECTCSVLFNGEKLAWECEKLARGLFFVRFGENCGVFCLNMGKAALYLKDAPVIIGRIDGFDPETLPEDAGDGMVGTNVRWVFGVNRWVDHDYNAVGEVRSVWSRNTVKAGPIKTFRDNWVPKESDYNVEKMDAIHFGKSFYVVDVKAEVPAGVCAPAEMKRLVLLQDYDHMMTVGCAFGDMEPIMLAGYAKFLN